MGYTHLGAGFVFTKFFSLVFLLGIILFLVWAIRTLDKKQLKKWVIGLVVVGLIGIVGSSLVMMKFGINFSVLPKRLLFTLLESKSFFCSWQNPDFVTGFTNSFSPTGYCQSLQNHLNFFRQHA